jgi:hypothetical protein
VTDPATVWQVLADFEPLSLTDVGAASLQDRVDRKYLVPAHELPVLLASLRAEYRVLEVDGARAQAYATTYLDTPDLAFYHAHHNARAVRHKVRVRDYRSSGVCFLEVKCRRASGRTSKFRASVPVTDAAPLDSAASLPMEARQIVQDATLGPSASTQFDRVTLVRRDGAERVTIDTRLTLSAAGATLDLGDVAFVEVKQGSRGPSPVASAMALRQHRPHSVSKYCVAVALLHPQVKHNRFKPVLARLAHIAGAPLVLSLAS